MLNKEEIKDILDIYLKENYYKYEVEVSNFNIYYIVNIGKYSGTINIEDDSIVCDLIEETEYDVNESIPVGCMLCDNITKEDVIDSLDDFFEESKKYNRLSRRIQVYLDKIESLLVENDYSIDNLPTIDMFLEPNNH